MSTRMAHGHVQDPLAAVPANAIHSVQKRPPRGCSPNEDLGQIPKAEPQISVTGFTNERGNFRWVLKPSRSGCAGIFFSRLCCGSSHHAAVAGSDHARDQVNVRPELIGAGQIRPSPPHPPNTMLPPTSVQTPESAPKIPIPFAETVIWSDQHCVWGVRGASLRQPRNTGMRVGII